MRIISKTNFLTKTDFQMKTKFLPKRMKYILLILSGFISLSIGAQNISTPPQTDYLSVIKGTFEYVLFPVDTELDSLDALDHALFKQREIIEKETMALNGDGRNYSETETLWYDGYPMWREPFWKLRREADYTLMYLNANTITPDTSFHSEISIEMNDFLDSLGIGYVGAFEDYYMYTPFPDKGTKSEYVTELDPGVFQVVLDSVTTIFDNNEKSIETIYPDHTVKEYYSRLIDNQYFLSFRIESMPFQLRNGGMAKRMVYSRFSNYKFSERENFIRSNDFEVNNMLRVFPNPSAEELTIEIPEKFREGICKMEIFDLSGKRCFSQIVHANQEVTLMLSNFLNKEGVYILQLTNNRQDRSTENFFFSKS
jgi:hypothetical protein